MAHSGSRSGAANLAIPLMIAAFLVIGAFLWWLSATAVGTAGPVETTSADTADAGPAATQVELVDLQTRPDSLLGQDIQVEGAEVASRMGAQAFWIELPNQNPFLVRLAPALVADSVEVQQNQTVRVRGALHAMNDSVLNAWVADTVISEGQRIEAEFATHFIEATRVERQGGQQQSGEQDGGGDAG